MYCSALCFKFEIYKVPYIIAQQFMFRYSVGHKLGICRHLNLFNILQSERTACISRYVSAYDHKSSIHFRITCRFSVNGRAYISNDTFCNNAASSFLCAQIDLPMKIRRYSTQGPDNDRRSKNKLVKDGTSQNSSSESLKDNIVTLPNLLTITRMVLSPIIGYLVLEEMYTAACCLFVTAGLTDLADGWIARNMKNQTSAAGSFLDPLADKFLISILFVTLTMVELLPVELTVLVIGRDICLVCAAFYVRYISLLPPRSFKNYFNITNASAQLKPTFISKVNTATQLFLVAASLIAPIFSYVDSLFLHALWFLTASTTVISAYSYIISKDSFRIIRKR